MFELEEYIQWIKDERPLIRQEEVKILSTINPVDLAYKATLALKPAITGFTTLTATCGSIGRLILLNHENPESDERTISLTRVRVGYFLLNVLFKNKKLKLVKGDDERDPYRIKIVKEAIDWIDELFRIVEEEPLDIEVYCRPTFEEPEPFVNFIHPVAGEIVRGVDRRLVKEFTNKKIPLAYEAINKHMDIPYVANMELLSIYYKCKDDDIFTLAHKKLTDEQKDGMEREMTTTMQIAKGTKGRKFWQYMFYDRRKRKYSAAGYFLHQGSKLAKSLFLFHTKYAITEEGWRWFEIHLANTFGYDKETLDKRVKFTQKNMKKWLKIASDPVKYKGWQKADDPFNFLAAIIEAKKAIDSGDKYSYETGLMGALDATNSGCQVLSLLSRDKKSGKECNLVNTKVRGDYYKMIADKVWEECVYTDEEFEKYHDTLAKFTEGIDESNKKIKQAKTKDAKTEAFKERKEFTENNRETVDMLARVFWGRPEIAATARTLSKRPCMTYLYSCQARTMSKALYKDHRSNKLYAGMKPFLCYWLCVRIYNACRSEMPKATEMMDLMIAVGITDYWKKQDFSLKLPVTNFLLTQKYRENIIERIKVQYKKREIKLSVVVGRGLRLDYRKIVNANSPNWVHGLDGEIVSRLFLDTDYEITSIHDSFSTHICNMGRLYKDTRTALHSTFPRNLIFDQLKQKGFDLREQEEIRQLMENEAALEDGRTPRKIKLWDGILGDLDSDDLFDNEYCFS